MMDEKPKQKVTELEGEDLDAANTPVTDKVAPGSTAGSPPVKSNPPSPKGPSLWHRIRSSKNLYLFVFVGILLFIAAVVAAALIWGKGSDSDSTPQKLTAEQLAELAGSQTVVGDSKQTLTIQSNTVFEGQVLARSDFSVAGALSVGGALSLPSLDVGSGSFDQLQVDNDLAVGGGLVVNGTLSVSGATSFKNLSASQLNVTSLTLSGDLAISRHITTSGGGPSKSNGAALGSGGTASVSGSDTAGTVAINTGSSPPAGCFITINFVNKFADTPHVVISPSNSSAGSLSYYTNRSTAGFSICTASTPSAATNYIFDYVILD